MRHKLRNLLLEGRAWNRVVACDKERLGNSLVKLPESVERIRMEARNESTELLRGALHVGGDAY